MVTRCALHHKSPPLSPFAPQKSTLVSLHNVSCIRTDISMIPWKTITLVIAAFGVACAITFAFWVIDLWAKAYDGPAIIRVVAILSMAGLAGGICRFLSLVSRLVLAVSSTAWRWGLA